MNAAGITPEHADALARLADQAAEHRWSHQVVRHITDNEASQEARLLARALYPEPALDSVDASANTRPLLMDTGEQVVQPADVDEEMWSVWAAVAERATHPRIRSTLHDLLFWGRQGDVGHHALEAATAYVELIRLAESIAQVDAARRAFSLIRLADLSDLRAEAVETALRSIQATLDELEGSKPGVSLGLLEVLVEHEVEDEQVDALLKQCRDAYPDAWNTTSTIELQRQRTGDRDARRELDRQEVQAWLDEAATSEPMAALIHYERAANLAADRGIADLRNEAIGSLQSISPEELPLQRITSAVEIPGEQIEAYISHLVGDDSWWNVAIRIVAQGPPSGRIEQNREQAREQAEMFPLQNIIPAMRLGNDGLPRYQPVTEEEREDAALARLEVVSIQLGSQFAAEALERATSRYGAVSEAQISQGLSSNAAIDETTASAVGRVVERFERGDYEAATFTALALIERLIRNLLLTFDAPIYRTQRQRTPGQYPGLGALLHQLSRRGLDPSWHRYLHTLLTSPVGLNLRNEALHGFLDNVDRQTAVAVLIALFYLTFLGPG